jgi:hypothetical protein
MQMSQCSKKKSAHICITSALEQTYYITGCCASCADVQIILKKTRLRVNGLNILFCFLASVIIVALFPKG